VIVTVVSVASSLDAGSLDAGLLDAEGSMLASCDVRRTAVAETSAPVGGPVVGSMPGNICIDESDVTAPPPSGSNLAIRLNRRVGPSVSSQGSQKL
jgi:hypothetical protein